MLAWRAAPGGPPETFAELVVSQAGPGAAISGTLLKRIPVFAALALYAQLALAGMKEHSAAWDETHYLGLGNYLLKHRDWSAPSAMLHPYRMERDLDLQF